MYVYMERFIYRCMYKSIFISVQFYSHLIHVVQEDKNFACMFFVYCYCALCMLSLVWLCDPMDCSPPGSSVLGIFRTRILEWIAIPFMEGFSPSNFHSHCKIKHWIWFIHIRDFSQRVEKCMSSVYNPVYNWFVMIWRKCYPICE